MGRRVVSCAMLLGFWGAGIGIPVPTSIALLDKADEPFPCRYHACGCRDAESCRLHCCCMKPRQAPPSARSCCAERRKPAASPPGPVLRSFECKGATVWTIAASIQPVPLQKPAKATSAYLAGRISPHAEECPASLPLEAPDPPPEHLA